MTNLKKLQLQQQLLENTVTEMTKVMVNMLNENNKILNGLEEDPGLPVVQIEEPKEPKEPKELFFIGQKLFVNGYNVTISQIEKSNIGGKILVSDNKGGNTIQDIVIPREVAAAAHEATKAKEDEYVA